MTTQASNGTDQLLADILGELAEKFKSGDPVDPDAYLASYPEHVEDLRRLLPAMQAIADLGVSASVSSAPLTANADAAPLADVLGDYRIIRQIGRGGMGVVYEAEQLSMRRRVALKVLPFAAVIDQRQLARFKNEAMAAGLLTHQNIVPIYSVGCEKGVHYYAMQYIQGHTLAEVIGQLRRFSGLQRTDEKQSDDGFEVASQVASGKLESSAKVSRLEPTIESGAAAPESDQSDSLASPPHAAIETKAMAALSTEKSTKSPEFFRTIAQLGIQAAEALDHAHKQGVLHRDVKPANLILDGTGNLWMTDFGLARLEANPGMTMTGDLIGTLRYMSPEQAMAKRVIVDHRTDIDQTTGGEQNADDDDDDHSNEIPHGLFLDALRRCVGTEGSTSFGYEFCTQNRIVCR